MAKLSITFDTSDFMKRSSHTMLSMKKAQLIGLRTIGNEILRLSQLEVPFKTGELLSSGISQQYGLDDWVVGYNKVYATYMHEGHWFDGSHIVKHYSNNRKKHYVSDPIRMNRDILREYLGLTIKKELSGL